MKKGRSKSFFYFSSAQYQDVWVEIGLQKLLLTLLRANVIFVHIYPSYENFISVQTQPQIRWKNWNFNIFIEDKNFMKQKILELQNLEYSPLISEQIMGLQ